MTDFDFAIGDRVRVVEWIFDNDYSKEEALGQEGTVTQSGPFPYVKFDNLSRNDGSGNESYPMGHYEIEKVEDVEITITTLEVGTTLTEEHVGKQFTVAPKKVESTVFEEGKYYVPAGWDSDYKFYVDRLVSPPGNDAVVAVGWLTYDDDSTEFEYEYEDARSRFTEVRG